MDSLHSKIKCLIYHGTERQCVKFQDGGQYGQNTKICIYQLIGELLATLLKSYIFKLLALRTIAFQTFKLSKSTTHMFLYLTYEPRYTHFSFGGQIWGVTLPSYCHCKGSIP